jgi:hypothetical protein
MTSIVLVFSMVRIPAGPGIIKARASHVSPALSTWTIEFMIVTSPMPCIPSSVITIAPAMSVLIVICGISNGR